MVDKRVISHYYQRPKSVGLEFIEPSMAQQQFANEVDLNELVDRNMRFKDPSFVTKLQLAGKLNSSEAVYGDFANVEDFHGAMNLVVSAKEQFMSLPSSIRDRFDNDPSKLLKFVENPNNYDEGVKLGIFEAKKPEIVVTPDVNIKEPVKAGVDAVSGPVTETSAQPLT